MVLHEWNNVANLSMFRVHSTLARLPLAPRLFAQRRTFSHLWLSIVSAADRLDASVVFGVLKRVFWRIAT